MKERIETLADSFVMMVRDRNKIPLAEIKKLFKDVPEDVVDKWISVFEKKGLIELVYPANPMVPPYLVAKYGEE